MISCTCATLLQKYARPTIDEDQSNEKYFQSNEMRKNGGSSIKSRVAPYIYVDKPSGHVPIYRASFVSSFLITGFRLQFIRVSKFLSVRLAAKLCLICPPGICLFKMAFNIKPTYILAARCVYVHEIIPLMGLYPCEFTGSVLYYLTPKHFLLY